jgi:hypothetical protein
MTLFRALLAVAMTAVGAFIVVEMLRYPIAQTYTGVILGLAMMGLGLYRLTLIRRTLGKR